MTYATKQDLIDRFGETELRQLTDRTNRPASTIDDTVVDRALTDAAALINGYLAKVYSLPLASTPAVLTRVAADVARYLLHGKAAETGGPVARAYDQAVAWLRDVARGTVQLEVGGTPAAATGGGQVRTTGPDRTFTRDSLRGL